MGAVPRRIDTGDQPGEAAVGRQRLAGVNQRLEARLGTVTRSRGSKLDEAGAAAGLSAGAAMTDGKAGQPVAFEQKNSLAEALLVGGDNLVLEV